MKEIIDFNLQQVDHVRIHQELVLQFAYDLVKESLRHDRSKFSEAEYKAFVDSRQSLNQSKTGTDPEYQKHLNGEAIQHHIHNNTHHPEYWDDKGENTMPVSCAIQMYFDWKSRSVQRNNGMDSFWAFNLSKLTKQPAALAIVSQLRKDFP